MRLPVHPKIQVGFFAVVTARSRAKQAHIQRAGLGGQRENLVEFDLEKF